MKNVTPAAGQVWKENKTGNDYVIGINPQGWVDGQGKTFGFGGYPKSAFLQEFTFQPQKDTKMTTNGEKFNAICELFPVTAREMAKSAKVNIGELRGLIVRGDYYIDDNCGLRRNATVKAFNELADAVDKLNAKEPPQKEIKMIVSKAKVGDEFLLTDIDSGNSAICELVRISKIGMMVFETAHGGLFVTDEHGVCESFNKRITDKHDPRHWLKDLPDADLFGDSVMSILVSAHNEWNYELINGVCCGLSMLKMPKLTGDEWRNSKISIPDLKAWQEQNK